MPLTCNIDTKGKRLRFINGIVMTVIGLALALFLAWPQHSTILWGVSAVCLLSGAFAIFEARAGWCVVRAMGFKTKV